MDVLIERACGLDVHQATVVACLITGAGKQKRKEIRSFPTMTASLRALRDWLKEAGCTHVAMESTGVYWQPVYAVLDGHFELVIGNARHMKAVPGRKTDVKDSEWIADLLRMGLIRPSFVPPKPLRELRELLRYRRKLVESATAERNRVLKLLETANIKLSSVASDVFGVSGMAMLRALIEGHSTPVEMAGLARGVLRRKEDDLALALDGCLSDVQRFMLTKQMHILDEIEATIAEIDAMVTKRLKPYQAIHRRLTTIPGVDWTIAAVIVAELGDDMSVFRDADHAAAWAGVCPGNNESAGKRRPIGARQGNVHLKTALVTAAIAASRKKDSYLRDKYYRLRARRGPLRAAVAVAHKILIAAFHMIARGTDYKDLGPAHVVQAKRTQATKYAVRQLNHLGWNVLLSPKGLSSMADAVSP
jgi:transposase